MARRLPEPAAKAETPTAATQTVTPAAAKSAELRAKKAKSKDKSAWGTFKDSVKQGAVSKCTQALISMNQCRE